jgi:hypothetical protein
MVDAVPEKSVTSTGVISYQLSPSCVKLFTFGGSSPVIPSSLGAGDQAVRASGQEPVEWRNLTAREQRSPRPSSRQLLSFCACAVRAATLSALSQTAAVRWASSGVSDSMRTIVSATRAALVWA